MSNYFRDTIHPLTGAWEKAAWLDNYFGPNRYGVRFPDGNVYDPEKINLQVRTIPPGLDEPYIDTLADGEEENLL